MLLISKEFHRKCLLIYLWLLEGILLLTLIFSSRQGINLEAKPLILASSQVSQPRWTKDNFGTDSTLKSSDNSSDIQIFSNREPWQTSISSAITAATPSKLINHAPRTQNQLQHYRMQPFQPQQQLQAQKQRQDSSSQTNSRPKAQLLESNTSNREDDDNVSFNGGLLRKSLLGLQNPRLFGGDILLKFGKRSNNRMLKIERSALVSSVSLWPDGVIFYEFDPSIEHLTELIWKVMQQFHDETCIRFVPRENNEPDFIRIEALRGCFSYIGRIGGEQTLSLGEGCEYKGIISHELLHVVGFYHHQNRSDRDDFLEILWENIARGKESQFYKMAPHENTLLNEFDYNSIMLYGPRTFGKTFDRVTMKPKRDGVILLEIIEKQGLSAVDIDSVNKLYKCWQATTISPD